MLLKLVFMAVLLVLSQTWRSNGCLETERTALLQLKPFFNSALALQNWVDDDDSLDCCQWERVQCSTVTRQVTRLFLNNSMPYQPSGNWFLNASLFLPFEGLMTLYLNRNSILGCIENEGFDRLSTRLHSLEVLDLSNNFFDDSILPSLSGFSSLRSLNLGMNPFKTPILAQDFPNSENLEELYLDKIELNNSFLQSVRVMTSMKVLSLSGCGLTGRLPNVHGLCELIHLRVLDLSSNDLEGSLPWCLANLTSLQQLDLSSNQFSGDISKSPLKNLNTLVELDISHNHFQVPFSLGSFFNHSNLKHINVKNNEIYMETGSHSAPRFQLSSMIFSGHGNFRTFPSFLYHQNNLQIVEFWHLTVEEAFPNWLLTNNTGLKILYLVNNSLSGHLQLPVNPYVNLLELDISNNYLSNHIPWEIGTILPKLELLNMSRNGFDGTIPSSFGKMNSIEVLDLSNNQLSGSIPEDLATGCLSLNILMLSNNSLQGRIFSQQYNLTSLWWLQLDNNKFSGWNPENLAKSPLSILDLSNNHLFGRIPGLIGKLSNLQNLILSHNHLEGSIPEDFCQFHYLEVLDLANNNVSGILPSCFSPPTIIHLHLSDNRIEGPWTNALSESRFLITLDLSNNQITGRIPSWIGGIGALRFLLLKNNRFDGEIPVQICSLYQLSLIDLSRNYLSGSIPSCLQLDHSDSLAPDIPQIPIPLDPYYLPVRPMSFTTKRRSYSYHGKILSYLSGIDFSNNNLTGKIPPEIGNLSVLHSLNLSCNRLIGSIPSTFSNLRQIESLDLSHNNLDGKIPSELVELNFLSAFSVAYNKLCGKTPERSEQFATFEESSYKGNPCLCGQPLPKSCTETKSLSETRTSAVEEDDTFLDINTFYVSFTVSYVSVITVIFLVLYINPHWQRAWFKFVDTFISCSHLQPCS